MKGGQRERVIDSSSPGSQQTPKQTLKQSMPVALLIVYNELWSLLLKKPVPSASRERKKDGERKGNLLVGLLNERTNILEK